jgi:hypothetical protein
MKPLQMIAYVWCIVIGAYMITFTADGKIIVICITCGPVLTNILAVISIAVGAIGIVTNARAKSNVQG